MGLDNADLNLAPPIPDSNPQSELTLSKPSFLSELWEVLTSASPPNCETQMISCVHGWMQQTPGKPSLHPGISLMPCTVPGFVADLTLFRPRSSASARYSSAGSVLH